MRARLAVAALAAGLAVSAPAGAAEAPPPPAQDWSFSGIFGTFDRATLRRGYQVYDEVCSACHGLDLLSYRNLIEIGFSADQVKAIAAEKDVLVGPDAEGEMFERPAKPADRFVSPFPNDNAARFSNNGSLPPDLSLMTKARFGGADYLYALLTGFEEEPPEGVEMFEDMYYNAYFPGHQIAMAPPLDDGMVEYADGTEPTLAEAAHDVSAFLAWAAEPALEERKRLGVKVMLFLLVLTGLLYAVKRKVWRDLH